MIIRNELDWREDQMCWTGIEDSIKGHSLRPILWNIDERRPIHHPPHSPTPPTSLYPPYSTHPTHFTPPIACWEVGHRSIKSCLWVGIDLYMQCVNSEGPWRGSLIASHLTNSRWFESRDGRGTQVKLTTTPPFRLNWQSVKCLVITIQRESKRKREGLRGDVIVIVIFVYLPYTTHRIYLHLVEKIQFK